MTDPTPTTFTVHLDELPNEVLVQLFDTMSLEASTTDDIKSLLFELWNLSLLVAYPTKGEAADAKTYRDAE